MTLVRGQRAHSDASAPIHSLLSNIFDSLKNSSTNEATSELFFLTFCGL